jgi:pyruvate formate lyase activating enzyme
MSGGLTISGGEPLMQDRFVLNLFKAAKAMGIHTALDTNGSLGARLADEEMEFVDLVLLDFKAWDPVKHRRLTAQDPEPTREFARRLAARRRPIWVRFVLVPGLTDDLDEVEHIAQFAAELGVVERVDVLPFHQMGRYKWEKLGGDYELGAVEAPSNEIIERVCATFRTHGLKTY